MAKVFDNGIVVATGFRLDDPRPLDDKDLVSTFNDLLTLENAYEGITVKVQDENYAAYTWVTGDQNVIASWQMSAGGGGIDPTAIHIDQADEFATSAFVLTASAFDRLLLEDASDSLNKIYTRVSGIGLRKTVVSVSVITSGHIINHDHTLSSVEIIVSGDATTFTINNSFSETGLIDQWSQIIIENQRDTAVVAVLGDVDVFEGNLTSSFSAEPGVSRINVIASRTRIIAALGGDVGGGSSVRAISETTISANSLVQMVDMQTSTVVRYQITDMISTGTIRPINISNSEEQNNKRIFDNRNNSVGFNLTVDTISDTINYSVALNDFPGTFPIMNITAGSYWEIEFQNETSTQVALYFAEKDIL